MLRSSLVLCSCPSARIRSARISICLDKRTGPCVSVWHSEQRTHPNFMLVCRVCSATALETGAAAAGGKSDLNSASRVCGLGIELEDFFLVF